MEEGRLLLMVDIVMKRNKWPNGHVDGHITEKDGIMTEVTMLHTIHLSRKIITENRSWQPEMRKC